MSSTAKHATIVTSPFDGRAVGEVPRMDAAAAERAISRAHGALRVSMPAHERSAVLDRAANIVRQRREWLAQTICDEAGKPIAAARIEVDRAVDTLTFSAAEARTLVGEMIPMDASSSGTGKLGFTLRQPVGVVAAISPFNFPLNLSCHKIGPAIAAGCPVVHKPASATPLSAVALHGIMLEAGLPAERYQLVTGPAGDVGNALVDDPRVALITFTGSSDVGWGIRTRAPRTTVNLELGNSTPLIICNDADVQHAVELVARHAFTHAGQSCISVQRLIVERRIGYEFVEALTARVEHVPFGDPANEETVVGPVIDAEAADEIAVKLRDARAAGAHITIGGAQHGSVIEPFVVAEATPEMDVFRTELFGPGVTVTHFDTDDEAVELANATPYGLQAGVLAHDVTRALAIAERLDFGGVTINEAPTFRADQMPYGGVKDSGNTREGPHWAVRAMTESKLVVLQR